MLVSVRSNNVRFLFFVHFFTANCPTAENPRAIHGEGGETMLFKYIYIWKVSVHYDFFYIFEVQELLLVNTHFLLINIHMSIIVH